MNIEAETDKYSEYMEPDVLLGLLSKPIDYLGEDVSEIIPSLAIGEDGITLASLFLVSQNYICEVRIKGRNRGSFDFAGRTMCNFRVEWGTQDIVVDEQVVASYETAELTIVHAFRMSTTLLYAGSNRDAWMADVRRAFPLDLMLEVSGAQ